MGIRTFTLLLLLSGGGLALAQDEVTLTDGRVLKGRVVDEGHQIRLVKDLGSIPISKRDIVKVRIDRERLPEGDLVDRVVLNNGSEIAGTIRLERDGRVVVVTGKFGEVKYARSEIREIVYAKGEDGSLDKTKEGAARRVDELLDAMTDPAREEEARAQIIRLGVYAIPHLERALPQAEGANRETIDHLLRVNRLRTVLTREIEETVSEVKDRLLDGDPEVRFAALQDIVLYHLKDSAPVLIYLLENGETDSKIRGYVIDRLAKQRRNSDLIELLQTGDSNIRLAAALALGENGIFLGVPILILALGVDDEAVRVAVFEKLKRFTGEDLLYWPKDPAGDSTDVLHADALAQAKSDREEAIARWEEWWDQNGEGLIRVSMKEFRRSVVSSKEKEEAEKFFSQGANIVERISEDGKAP
ncbi:MAG: hypothetical protein O7H41_19075 [Planctomycetota bacterium]|nr:hypothetical protein [Planctomycetota bacterium]